LRRKFKFAGWIQGIEPQSLDRLLRRQPVEWHLIGAELKFDRRRKIGRDIGFLGGANIPC
jgi:tetrahydromethanopterin S-methyltransferase subunit G